MICLFITYNTYKYDITSDWTPLDGNTKVLADNESNANTTLIDNYKAWSESIQYPFDSMKCSTLRGITQLVDYIANNPVFCPNCCMATIFKNGWCPTCGVYQRQVTIGDEIEKYFEKSQKSNTQNEFDLVPIPLLNIASKNDTTLVATIRKEKIKFNLRDWIQLLLKELNFKPNPNRVYFQSWQAVDVIDINENDQFENESLPTYTPVNNSIEMPLMDEIMNKYQKYLNVMPNRTENFDSQKKLMINKLKTASRRVNAILNEFGIDFNPNFDNSTFLSIDCWSAAAAPWYRGSPPQHCGYRNYLIWNMPQIISEKNSTGLLGIKLTTMEVIGL